jgi:type IV pilus assembly protein PilQ
VAALVQSVELTGQDAESLIKISADQELKYNVFKLTGPDRVMVDLIDARLAEGVASELAGNDLISAVRVQSIEDSLSNLVRIEIELVKSGNYMASIDGNSLDVRVIPVGTPMPASSETAVTAPSIEGASALPPLAELETPKEVTRSAEPMAEAKPESSTEAATPEAATSLEEPVAPILTPVVPVAPPAEEKVAESPAFEAPSQEERRFEVLPEGESGDVVTQDLPSTVITEGTSTLTGMSSRVYTGNRVSIEFQDAQIQDVLRLIADVSKLNIIIADDVKGTLTLKLVDVPWDQALDIIMTSKGLDKVQHGNVLRVAPIESLKKERELALANDKAAKQLEPTRIKIFSINYAAASEMADRIKTVLSERGKADTDDRTNTIIVEDIAENLSRVEGLIKVLDTQTPQVRIESRIVQANDRFSRSFGIQWGPTLRLDESNNPTSLQFPRTINVGSAGFTQPNPTALQSFAIDALPGSEGSALGLRLGSVSDIFNLDLQLQYAEIEQMGRVVSRPSITVLDNKKASIIQGSRIPFLSSSSEGSNVQFQEAGVEISVTPQITNDGAVLLEVSARSNEPGSESVGGNRIINIREAQTELLVKSGRTAVLGGVFKTSDTRGESGVPGLKEIPILGHLFKGRSRSTTREETLIFITPYILTDNREGVLSPQSTSKIEN